MDAELPENVVLMCFYCPGRQSELVGDLFGNQSLAAEFCNLEFPLRQGVRRIAGHLGQVLDDGGHLFMLHFQCRLFFVDLENLFFDFKDNLNVNVWILKVSELIEGKCIWHRGV